MTAANAAAQAGVRAPAEVLVVKPDEKRIDYAIAVSKWTQGAGNMLPKSPEDILELFIKERAVVIVDAQQKAVSHAAATHIYSDGSIEIGSVYTAQEYRSQGAATKAVCEAVAMMRDQYPDRKIFALGSGLAAKVFEKMGAEEMATTELHTEVWKYCTKCPKNPNAKGVISRCCNTAFDLTGL